ncbi:hypothetical protein [Streptomyces] [Streptomyces violaceorubidus]
MGARGAGLRVRDTITCVLDIGYALSTRSRTRRRRTTGARTSTPCGTICSAGTCTSPTPRRTGSCPQPGDGCRCSTSPGRCATSWSTSTGTRRSRAARPRAELDFTESTDRLLFERRFGWVDIEAEWLPADEPLSFSHTELRREARDFLHDLLADLTDLHEDLADNPAIWTLQSRFPRVS